MSDLSITAANVLLVSGNTFQDTSAVALTAGQAIYKDSSVPGAEVMRLADADASATAAAVKGIALHACAAGQPIKYQIDGDITIGATLTVGTLYVVSASAGGIAPVSDYTTNWYGSVVGIGKTTTVLKLGLNAFGVLHA